MESDLGILFLIIKGESEEMEFSWPRGHDAHAVGEQLQAKGAEHAIVGRDPDLGGGENVVGAKNISEKKDEMVVFSVSLGNCITFLL